ncbi:MAG: oligosaccharide flippase family protein [Candidatus Nanoarchaeia archaeon]|nr:oligosaccharide flippase family protein [Candidatus Nanoarchaeia archaeon]MDD5239257.1 oligosaccharide flippase family protein [Candidatus Nanoarchaeia archaeon]
MQSSVFKHGFLYVGAAIINAAIVYIFYFLIGRHLTPAEFGVFGTIIAIFSLLAIVQNSLQTAVSKLVSGNNSLEDLEAKISNITFNTLVFSAVIFALLFVFNDALNQFFHFDSRYLLIFSALLLPFLFLLSITRGYLQGVQKFGHLSISIIVDAVVKLGIGILAVLLGLRVYGAVGAFISGYAFAFIVSIPQTKLKFSIKDLSLNFKFFLDSWPILLTVLFLTSMISIDVILVKHYFNADLVGFYNLASFFGKVLFCVAINLAFVMFPKISELHMSKQEHKHVLRDSLNLMALMSVCVFVAYTFFSKFLVNLFFGSGYAAAAELLPLFGISSILLAFSLLLSFYLLAQDKKMFLIPLAAVFVLETALIVFMHGSLLAVAKILVFSNLVYLAAVLFVVFGYKLKNIFIKQA